VVKIAAYWFGTGPEERRGGERGVVGGAPSLPLARDQHGEDGGSGELVPCKFSQPKWRGFKEDDIKKGAEGGGDWYRVRHPLCFFFSDVFFLYFFNIRLPYVYALRSVFIVQESHHV